MSYIINRTDGSVLTEITDGNIDQLATDLTLIGKSTSAYGEYINENLVHLLENFANTTKPAYPIQGQLWYDTNERRLKIYDNVSGFKLTGGTVVSTELPSSITQGDIWIDSKRQQLWFNDGVSTILAGPYLPADTGFNVLTVKDTYNIGHSIVLLVVNGSKFAIFSTDEFTPDSSEVELGFNGTIKQGINLMMLSVITNVADPISSTDAVNKDTLDITVSTQIANERRIAPQVISVDVTGVETVEYTIITTYLNPLFPPKVTSNDIDNNVGLKCKVICTDTLNESNPITIRQFIINTGGWAIN